MIIYCLVIGFFGFWIFLRYARGRGRSESMWGDCLTKTQVYANSKEEVYGLRPAQCRKVN